MTTYRLTVGGLTGDHDAARIRDALAELDVVRLVEVEEITDAGTLEVTVRTADPVNELREAVESLGYSLVDLDPL